MGIFSTKPTKEQEYQQALQDLNAQVAAQHNQLKAQQSIGSLGSVLTVPSGSYLSPSYTTTTIGSMNQPYYTTAYGNSETQTPWVSPEDKWEAEEVQAAASQGWLLTGPAFGSGTKTPTLAAWSWGTKTDHNAKELLEDVVTQAVTGNSPIAYRILCILTKNRSPWAEWADTAKVLAAEYEK